LPTAAREPPPLGWMKALLALLGGSFLAVIPVLALLLVGGAVGLLPDMSPRESGVGWPWRIEGAWSLLADLGPLLFVATLVAGGVGFYVANRVGEPTARWPIALCATLVGWIPIAHDGNAGLVGASGGLAFFAMWFVTHRSARMPRRRLPGDGRLQLALCAVLAIGLTATTLSYGALHPLHASASVGPYLPLRDGRTERVALYVHNEGALPVRVLALSIPAVRDLRVGSIERPGRHSADPSAHSAGQPTVAAGDGRTLWVTLGAPPNCAGLRETFDAIDVRIAVAGLTRVQRVRLDEAVRVRCRSARRG
jgi:hypothetical protein